MATKKKEFEPAQLNAAVQADLRQSHLPLGVWEADAPAWPPKSVAQETFADGSGSKPEKPFNPNLQKSHLFDSENDLNDEEGRKIMSVQQATFKAPDKTVQLKAIDPNLQQTHIKLGEFDPKEQFAGVYSSSFKTHDPKDSVRVPVVNPQLQKSHIMDPSDLTDHQPMSSDYRNNFPKREVVKFEKHAAPELIRKTSKLAYDVEKSIFDKTGDEIGPKDFKPSDIPEFRDLATEREKAKKALEASGPRVDSNWKAQIVLGEDTFEYKSVKEEQEYKPTSTEKFVRAKVPAELYASKFKIGDAEPSFSSVYADSIVDPKITKDPKTELAPAGSRKGQNGRILTADLQKTHFEMGDGSHVYESVNRESFKAFDLAEAKRQSAMSNRAHLQTVVTVADVSGGGEWITDYQASLKQRESGSAIQPPATLKLQDSNFRLGDESAEMVSDNHRMYANPRETIEKMGDQELAGRSKACDSRKHLQTTVSVKFADAGKDDWTPETRRFKAFSPEEVKSARPSGRVAGLRPDQIENKDFIVSDGVKNEWSTVARDSYENGIGMGLTVVPSK